MEFKLIIKKLKNTLSEEEKKVFLKWYNESISHKEYYNAVKQNYQTSAGKIDVERGWLILQSKLKRRKQRISYYKYAAVASIILLLSVNFLFNNKDVNKNIETILVNDNKISFMISKSSRNMNRIYTRK